MLDAYTRQRLDRMAVDVAVTRNSVEAIEKNLAGVKEHFENQEFRLLRVERRVFALWLIGPFLVATAVFLKTFKTWLTEN